MTTYYAKKLSGERLKRVYDIATPRVRQYLDAEALYVSGKICPGDRVLDVGCGYGRIMPELYTRTNRVTGIDISRENIRYGMENGYAGYNPECNLIVMDAIKMHFPDHLFDVVFCIQNGICAFNVDQTSLIKECVRVTRRGGITIFTSYSPKFWKHRLEWFELQAKEGLLGEIDDEKTGNGVIVCRDGFRAGFMTPVKFDEITSSMKIKTSAVEVDESFLAFELFP
jgi:2-polyprenyl-6-hydroxyphenyl methylase/3-demethylubiquinone-9 3-methyltransferase